MELIRQGWSIGSFQGLAAMRDDVVMALGDAVREPVAAREPPDVFDRIQFGRFGRERREADVRGHIEAAGEMPSRLVENENGVSVGRDHGADPDRTRPQGRGVAPGQDEPGALAFARTDRSEDIGPFRALAVGRVGPRSAARPSAGDPGLLADPRLILKPRLHALAVGLALPWISATRAGKFF